MHLLVNIDVPELGPAVDFYHDALGLTLDRFLDDDVAELSGTSSSSICCRMQPILPPHRQDRCPATTGGTRHRCTSTAWWKIWRLRYGVRNAPVPDGRVNVASGAGHAASAFPTLSNMASA